ncbi:helix-turn-helix domain-containing protein [Nocardiopsis ansamitocini]|uniref:Transcriptional regulator n=1 Tax=Nocardiopsis ansamitocini TaxID=1670832 RepID=A0A9W6P9A9_9ACTN|nr:transcriptional regulator [Nocardiopsis ansamitocini]
MANGPHDHWARFALDARRARELAGITQAQVAKATGWGRSTISSLETGARRPQRAHAEALDRVCDTNGSLLRLWVSLSSSAGDSPSWFRDVLVLEQTTTTIREYQPLLIPGLLQTGAYAHAVIRTGSSWFAPDVVDGLVRTRVQRQALLTRADRPATWFVVDDSAITRMLGGVAVMREQLDHLLRMGCETVRLQVLPSARPTHPGLGGPFRIMSFPDRPPVGYAEHALGGATTDDTRELEYLHLVFGAVQADALSPGDSLEFIRATMEGLPDD